ncbi:MAG TPA: hypothetical protein VGG46_06085 [Terriglobales bacterium]|jgi:hypothetical protein
MSREKRYHVYIMASESRVGFVADGPGSERHGWGWRQWEADSSLRSE